MPKKTPSPKQLAHLDSRGQAHMVDVGGKIRTRRTALAAGKIKMSAAAFALLKNGGKKGDALAVARIAAICAAKKTADWIPLCHTLPLESVRVEFVLNDKTNSAECRAETAANAKTGVEMEALTAVQAGLLALYDMLKSADRAMTITDIRLLEKRGGKSGDFVRKK